MATTLGIKNKISTYNFWSSKILTLNKIKNLKKKSKEKYCHGWRWID